MKRSSDGQWKWIVTVGLLLGCSSGQGNGARSNPDPGDVDMTDGGGAVGSDCMATAKACGSTADCCGGAQGKSLCIDFGSGRVCTDVCSKNSDCTTGCCAPTNSHGVKVCASSHCLAGLGTSCSSDEECSSGVCYGFCSTPCTSDADCAGGHGSYGSSNSYGNQNWCVENAKGSTICFPGCSSDSACTPFNNATCMANRDVNGADVGICSACVPACSGKTCGPDGCGGSCGSCPSGASCSSSGTCTGSSPTGSSTGGATFCTPGANQACSCVNTETGKATCSASGSAFGPCTCPSTKVWQPCTTTSECPSGDTCGGATSATMRCLPPVCADGSTTKPCPPIPGSAVGVTQSCSAPVVSGPPGEACADCVSQFSYCTLHCTATSKCPYGMTCVQGGCQ
jgi:hypothetical protein